MCIVKTIYSIASFVKGLLSNEHTYFDTFLLLITQTWFFIYSLNFVKVTVYYEDLNYEEFVEEPEIAVC